MSVRRRSAFVLLATGLTCLAGAGLPLFAATASPELGSGLGSYSLAANAPVVQLREDDGGNCAGKPANTAGCEGVVNETVSTLRNGPVGFALSAVGWPGTLAGNLGSLLIVAGGPSVPSQATVLNSPVRAENHTGGPDETVTNSTIPGATMTATATPTRIEAAASIGQSQATPVGTFGKIASATSTSLTGTSTAEAVAHSEVHDLTIAGVIHLGTVVSDVKAVTDGKHAVPSGRTVVTGATIAGVPVTIDEHGVTVQTQNVPLPSQATDAVNTALKNAGMTLAFSKPSGTPVGASVVYNAGSLVMFWQQQARQSLTIVLGGASVSVASAPDYTSSFGGPPVALPTFVGSTAPATVPVSGPAPITGGFTGATGDVGTIGPGPSVGNGPTAVTTVPVAARRVLPHGLSPWYAVLALLGAGLVMAGLRRLSDHVLVTSTSACPQGESA